MDKRPFIATYFRQQSDMGMPDLFVNHHTTRFIISRNQTPKIAAPPSGQSVKTRSPAVGTNNTDLGSFKKKLSLLRPLNQIVASGEIKTTEPLPGTFEKIEGTLLSATKKRAALKELLVASCQLCHLSKTRKNFVFGGGNVDAPVMVIGEAPGQDEDEQGLPFVGAAGKLLTTMLAAINLDRSKDVFITNILKCHPPGNRNPESSEIITCIPLLKNQINIIQPKALLLLGRIAAHALLDINDSIAKMRSRIFICHGIQTMVLYHPAALLRNADYKRPAWEDLKLFQKLLSDSGIYGSLRKE